MRESIAPRIRKARGKAALKAAGAATVVLTAGLTLAPAALAVGGTPAGTPSTVSMATQKSNKALADKMIKSDAQFACFSKIVERESTWNHHAVNKSSGAYGLVQALPAHKMATAGSDWRTNPATQIKWGLDYMNDRYGSPCQAWEFWQQNHWY
ncbi:transglycosylase SLT domain-containing protein [Streptomyces polyrhachis]|uniref:Transglycosylase SLT domain-containing protein n=1 Tax=Streptomyces polyrhachis TaxID=1282885 RepID=A0ABW2GL92_9ACTN